MKWIILLVIFSNCVDSLKVEAMGCLLSPHSPCLYIRTLQCKALSINDNQVHLKSMGEYLIDAVNNLARLSHYYLILLEPRGENSSTAGCSLGNS